MQVGVQNCRLGRPAGVSHGQSERESLVIQVAARASSKCCIARAGGRRLELQLRCCALATTYSAPSVQTFASNHHRVPIRAAATIFSCLASDPSGHALSRPVCFIRRLPPPSTLHIGSLRAIAGGIFHAAVIPDLSKLGWHPVGIGVGVELQPGAASARLLSCYLWAPLRGISVDESDLAINKPK